MANAGSGELTLSAPAAQTGLDWRNDFIRFERDNAASLHLPPDHVAALDRAFAQAGSGERIRPSSRAPLSIVKLTRRPSLAPFKLLSGQPDTLHPINIFNHITISRDSSMGLLHSPNNATRRRRPRHRRRAVQT